MDNIVSYLKWRGDDSLCDYPINELDCLILSMLSYVDFRGIIKSDKTGITLCEAAKRYLELNSHWQAPPIEKGLKRMLTYTQTVGAEIIPPLVNSDRFKDAVLSDYFWVFDSETQFAALHIRLADGTDFISFIGTDNTIAGWQEAFSVGFEKTRSQEIAVKYLTDIMKPDRQYRIGGHSKGGNTAVYSAMMIDDTLKNCIIGIYSFDSPGICDEMIIPEKYDIIKSKIHRFSPEFAIIGRLFHNSEPIKIVTSVAQGPAQHDAMTWLTERKSFTEAQHFDSVSNRCERVFKNWIEDTDIEHRREFVCAFFGSLKVSGAETLQEAFTSSFLDAIIDFDTSGKKSKKTLSALIKSISTEIRKIDLVGFIKRKSFLQSIGLMIAGLLFVTLPEFVSRIIGAVFVDFLLVATIFNLVKFIRDSRNNLRLHKRKLLIYFGLILIETTFLIHNHTFVLPLNLIMSFSLIGYFYYQIKKTIKLKKSKLWWLSAIDAFFALSLGIAAFVLAEDVVKELVMLLGVYMLCHATYKAIRTFQYTGR